MIDDIKNKNKSKNLLFVFQHLGYLKHFENTIRFLSEKSFTVTIIYYKEKKNFSPSVLERIHNMTGVKTIFLDDVISKSQKNSLMKMRRTIDSLQYKKNIYADCDELINRYPPISKWNIKFPENLMQFLSNDMTISENLEPKHVMHILSEVFYLYIETTKKFEKILKKIEPQAIILSPFLDGDTEPYVFLKYGRNQKIPTIYAMASWDNLQNKGIAKPAPDGYLVWTEDHKKQLIQIHDAEKEKIHVVGSELFELWGKLETEKRNTRNLEDIKPLRLLYCCSSDFITGGKEEKLLVKLVDSILTKNLNGSSIKLTIKTHPQVVLDNLKKKLQNNSANLDSITVVETFQNVSDDESSRDEFLKLIACNDVCLGINTSIMLEAAMRGLTVASISNSFEELKFPKTLHEKFLRKYVVKVLYNMKDFEELLENSGKFKILSGNIVQKMKEDFLISPTSDVSSRISDTITELVNVSSINKELRDSQRELSGLKIIESHPRNGLLKLINAMKSKHAYLRAFEILRETGIKSLVAHFRLFFQNQAQENYELTDSELAKSELNLIRGLLIKPIKLIDRREPGSLFDFDLVSCEFSNFKIKDAEIYREMLNQSMTEIRRLVGEYDNVIVGPWFSELGFELLYWVPFINSLSTENTFANKNVVTISRGGVEDLYDFLPSKHLNLLEYFSQTDWSDFTSNVWQELGGLKQSKLVMREVKMLKNLNIQFAGKENSKTLVLHPSLMFTMFRPFWRNKNWSADLIAKHLVFPNFKTPEAKNYGSVKIYSRPSLQINVDTIKKIEEFLKSEKVDLKIITSDSYKDDHEVFVFSEFENAKLIPIHDYENNLKLQLDIIRSSSVCYTTYGGLSYYPLYFGKKSIGFYTDSSKFDQQHTKVANLLKNQFGSEFILKQI